MHFLAIRALVPRLFLLLALLITAPLSALDVTVCRDATVPQSVFAVSEIRSAVMAVGGTITESPLTAHAQAGVTGVRVILARTGSAITGWTPLPAPVAEQAYAIRVKNAGSLQDILIVGADSAGTLYGGLDVADAIRMGTLGALSATDQSPRISQRGIKFNVPLDLRSPSYSDSNDAAQALIPKIWELSFWEEYLDEMVRQRLNTLSLWNLHPFPSMVSVKDYPAIALSDVWRTKVPFTSTGGTGTGIYVPDKNGRPNDVEIVKRLTPAQKTAFWNQVLDLAEVRGISVYIFTWNVMTDGTEGNPYGIVDDSASSQTKQDSAATKAYLRASVRAILTAMPKLAGFGITGGEQMTGSSADKVRWLADTYGAGVNDVVVGYSVTAPGGATTVVPADRSRKLRLIVRSHQINISDMDAIFGPVYYKNYTVDTSYKYSIAHTYSTTKPECYTSTMEGLAEGKRTWLTVRLDDQYNARWGDPDFVRDWVKNIPLVNENGVHQLNGYYMGPDGTTLGIRANVKDATLNQLDIKRWWYTQSLFSRLSYNPNLTNDYFDRLVAARLGITLTKASALNRGLAFASQITPWLTKYHWGAHNDYENFVEGCTTNVGFITVTNYRNNEPIGGDDGNHQSPLPMGEFCAEVRRGRNPIDIAEKIDALVANANTAIATITRDAADSELNQVLDDIRILVAMGRYYAAKFRGARDLTYADIDRADAAKAAEHRANAVGHLTNALARWSEYADLSAQRYHPTRHNRIGNFDLKAFTAYVAGDIAIANNLTSGGPTVATQPRLNSQAGATASLSVRGASTSDDESQLKYFWLIDGTHPTGVTYNANGSNAARDVTVTFTHSGRYRFKAIILDTRNRYKDSNAIEITYVASTTNQAPQVNAGPDRSVTMPAAASLSGSATDDGLPAGSALTRNWTKVSGPGTVTFANANLAATTATFSSAGSYVLRLTASDGTLSASDDVAVTVVSVSTNLPPTVAISAPASGALFTAPAVIAAAATATDSDGSVVTVEFLVDGVLRHAESSAPYTFAWNAVPAGTYQLSARATDNAGAVTTSTAVTVTVAASGTPPPKPGTPSVTGNGTATPTLSGNTTPGATIHILVDGVEIGSTTAAADGTWSYTITGSTSGTHVVTVTATHGGGTSPASDPITITVPATGGGGSSTGNSGGSGGGSCGSGSTLAALLLVLFVVVKAGFRSVDARIACTSTTPAPSIAYGRTGR